MALSQSVLDSLREAESHIRNALAYSSRQERPSTCASIAQLLSDLGRINYVDQVLDKLDTFQKQNPRS